MDLFWNDLWRIDEPASRPSDGTARSPAQRLAMHLRIDFMYLPVEDHPMAEYFEYEDPISAHWPNAKDSSVIRLKQKSSALLLIQSG